VQQISSIVLQLRCDTEHNQSQKRGQQPTKHRYDAANKSTGQRYSNTQLQATPLLLM
jgi:hypothetical protein